HYGAELYGRDRGDHRHPKLALQPFLDDLHVEHTEEPATKSKAQCGRRFWFPHQRGVVELKFFHGGPELFEFRSFYGVYSGEHHRLYVLETFDGLAGAVDVGDGIPHLHFARDLDS